MTPGTLGKWAPWALVIIVALWGSCQTLEASKARKRAATAALAASNEAAAHDSTRQLAGAVAKLLGDSLQAVQRLAVQTRLERDQLDRALKLERIASAGLRVTIAELRRELASGPVLEDTAGTRSASWSLRQPPYSIEATATLPRPPATGTLAIGVRLDSIPLHLRLSCGAPDQFGIRPAAATLTGPPWARLELGRVEQDQDVCRSPALVKKGPSRLKWTLIGAGLVTVIREGLKLLGGSE